MKEPKKTHALAGLTDRIADLEFHAATRLLISPNTRTQQLGARLRQQSRYLQIALNPGRN